MPTNKITGNKLADMMYGNPEGAAFGFFPQMGRRGQSRPPAPQPQQMVVDDRAMELPSFGDVDLSVPTPANRALGQRMVQRDVDLKRQADQDMSPLEKLAGGMQAGRLIGSGLVQAVKSIPTAVTQGGKAAEDYIAKNIYQPNVPKAYEYAGDVSDFLTSLETDYKIPPIMPEALALQFLAGPATKQAGKAAKRGALDAAMRLERGMEPIVNRALEGGGLPREMAQAMGANTQSNVIKPKDGNWLNSGSIERDFEKLKRFDRASGSRSDPRDSMAEMKATYTPEVLAVMSPETQAHVAQAMQDLERKVALNNWVDSNLTNYVKKQMGTPDDPVRKLAEQGIVHTPSGEVGIQSYKAPDVRAAEGREALGVSDAAKAWEDAADVSISPLTIKSLHRDYREPWMENANPNTKIYEPTNNFDSQALGFDHIMDVLREDLTTGRIRPEQLNKVSMEQAVRRTAEYDQELADKMNAARASQREGLPVYKEYPEGFRWVELNKPGSFASESESMGHSVRGYEPPKGHPDWTEASGDSGSLNYGHGGWEAIKSGKAKVYSLVDSKGAPHTTVEVAQVPHPISTSSRGDNFPELSGFEYGGKYSPESPYKPNQEQLQQIHSRAKELWSTQGTGRRNEIDRFYQQAAGEVLGPMPQKITQIKGKGNAAPNKEYLPFVQDFVKSGRWSDVDDLRNTGLRPIEKVPERARFEEAGMTVPRYVSDADHEQLINEYNRLTNPPTDRDFMTKEYGFPPPAEGMARGGRVHISDNPDVMQLELAVGGLVKAASKAATKGPAVPLTLPRVRPATKDILEAAERVGKQQAGEFVTNPLSGKTTNLAGRSKKEVERLKNMEYKVTPIKDLPEMKPYQAKVGEVNIALPGDQTISDMLLESVDGMPIGTTSEGGALFGRGRLTDPEETRAFWASGFSQADQFQRKVTELARLYDTDMVTAYHLAMGTLSNNFAQHLADAGLRATDYSKLSAPKMRAFDSLMRNGYVDPVTGKQIDFPNWPGLAFPEEAAQVMKEDPLLRKWYNNRMKTPKVTEALDLPNAKSIEYAMTEPDIRNMEINLTGLSAGRMKPGAELRPDSAHNTYSHDILGTAVGRAPELAPFSISFPDVTSFVREQYRPQDFTGTIQKVFPHQVVDEAYLEDMQKYYEQLRKVRGYKEGGAVSFSDDPDTMRLELAGGGLVKSAAKVAGKGLFSAVDRTAQNLKRPAGTGKEFMAEIKASPGIKATELKGRKLAEIEALPKMTKDQFIKELEARPPVKIEEKVLGQPSQKEIDELADKLAYDKSVESARYYGERGDDIDALAEENYLFNIRNNLEEFREEARQSLIDEGQGGPFHENKFTIPGGKNYREILLKAPAAKGEGFLGTPAHFGGEPNILASIRVSDRTGPNGEKILHVEEIQSDWHQAGRKKGYKEEYKSRFGDIDGQQMKVSDLIAQQGDAGIKWIEGKNSVNRDLDLPELAGDDLINVVTENGAPVLIKEARFSDITKMVDSHRRGVADLEAQERQLFNKSQQEKLPDAPFKKDWQELALRRVMQEAAEGGYDRVALTKGAEQADRYDLSKQVGRITYTPDINGGTLKATDLGNQNYIITETNVTPDRLEALIGKEAAQKLVDAPLEGGSQTLSGEGLKVGGEGMEGFYDKMLPDYLNKLGKQYGVEVSPVTITHPKNSGTTYNAIPPLTSTDFHGFEVTPQMRQDITEKGLPLYQQIGIPVGAGTAGTGTATIAPEGLGTNDEQQVQNPVNFTENPDAMLLEMMQRN